jgi:hypothetical protein
MTPISIDGIRFINLTPHDVTIIRKDGTSVVVPKSGTVARCESKRELADTFVGVELFRTSIGNVSGLDVSKIPMDVNVIIVSLPVRERWRASFPDFTSTIIVASPGDLIRDDKGQPVGCRGLAI